MQAGRRPVHGQPEAHDAARAERDPRQAARVDRPVAEDPQVRAQQVAVRGQRAREVRRARFLLALEEELEVGRERDLRGAQCVDCGEDGHDRPLVVARRARVDARLVRERVPRRIPGHDRRAVLGPPRTQRRLEGRRDPGCLGADGLPVEMRIEKERPCRARRREHAVDRHRRARRLEDARVDAALLQHADEERRVRADIRLVRRDVRQREQLAQLRDDRLLVDGDVLRRRGHRHRGKGRRRVGTGGVDGRQQPTGEERRRPRPVHAGSLPTGRRLGLSCQRSRGTIFGSGGSAS